jgi:uncharacterized protein
MTSDEHLTLKTTLLELHTHCANVVVGLDLIQEAWDTAQRQWERTRTNMTANLTALQSAEQQTLEQIAALLQQLEDVRPNPTGEGTR